MNKNPLILFNPKNEDVEFMHNHQVYIFRPGEKRVLEWDVANHALLESKTGLEVYDGSVDTVQIVPNYGGVAYDKMPWKQVVSMASKRGLFKPGMSKEEVLKSLQEADE